MKKFIFTYDCSRIEVVANNKDEAISIIQAEDESFFIDEQGTLMYNWDFGNDKYKDLDLEEVFIDEDVTNKNKVGIYHWQSE